VADPKVTVLMSVYNEAKYLNYAISSILNQNFRDFEFLIIDDGSTDDSRRIILSYNDSRIRLIENHANLGLTKSLNLGLRQARGKYIARMDADDISLPDRLEIQLESILRTKAGLVAGWSQIINTDGQVLKTEKHQYSPEEIYYWLHFRNCLFHSTVFFKTESVLGVGGYDERFKYAQDYNLWVKLLRKIKFYYIQRILIKYRKRDCSITAFHAKDQLKTVEKTIQANLLKITGQIYQYSDVLFLQRRLNPKLSNKKRSILLKALKQIHGGLLKYAPAFLNRPKLKAICNSRLTTFPLSKADH